MVVHSRTPSLTSALPAPSFFRRRVVIVVLCFLTVAYVFYHQLHISPISSSSSSLPLISILPSAGDREPSVSVSELINVVQKELEALQRPYLSQGSWEEDREQLGIKLGESGDDLNLEGYRRRIQKSLKEFFLHENLSPPSMATTTAPTTEALPSLPSGTISSTKMPYWSSLMDQHLYLDRIPEPDALLKQIYTTSYDTRLPDQFKGWKTVNPSWDIRFLSDDALNTWAENEKRIGAVKADLFRYLVLLYRGGVYTDIDTACVRPIEEWGKTDMEDKTAGIFRVVPKLASLWNPNGDKPSKVSVNMKPTVLPPPSLVVSIEHDSLQSDSNWRALTFGRGLQIVQWTLAAAPGHPIMVDAVSSALRTSTKYRKALAASKNGGKDVPFPDILEWTGPALLSDCVFRYLFARYGVTPRQLSGNKHPIRVGDVLILPSRSFQADISEYTTGQQDSVWHGFFGRWKEN
ncbi:Glycosyltransferase, DXD sugar-binding motif [Phaffia rhodozyma]|uniref:Glycosyltransferase, DXD sugar-binding motif n=1 Tax=Phaffia rhodozyma TaxID=264483 RepID=A0A0F7SG65_PHARH|nr:Glycosyltransferase, DXD sugar-binding motif [Phaffia rhodozyma]